MREYNYIYSKIVRDNNDFIGKIAYSIYKEDKISFINSFYLINNRNPTEEELKYFHEISSTDSSVERYKLQAETLLQQFLDNTLQEALYEATEEIKSNQLLLIREEIKKVAPPGFLNGVLQNVVASVALTAILALMILVAQFSIENFWEVIGKLFNYTITPRK